MTKAEKKDRPYGNASRALDYIFRPESVAVIGASSDSEKEMLRGWVGRLVKFGYEGKIYPINPQATNILGLRAYPTIASVPDSVDYAIISVPARLVPKLVQECISKGVKAIHIYTAGFAETGEREGGELQTELERIIRTSDSRLIGPNCLGVYSPASGFACNSTFAKESGPVGFLSQTGIGLVRLVHAANERGLRFSKAVSYGNAVDLDGPDFLEYFASDEETKLVLIYIEGVKDGQRFFSALRECNKVKPVVLLKGGMSESGAGAALSHTGSLAGSRQVWQALFRQTGAIAVQSFEEAVEQMVALLYMPPTKGRGVGLVGRGGGLGVLTSDICEREGLVVPQLMPETRRQLRKMTPEESGSMVRNPVEIGLGRFGISEYYAEAVRLVASDPQVDLVISFLDPEEYVGLIREDWVEDASKNLVELAKSVSKPLAIVLLQGLSLKVFEWNARLRHTCQEAGLATFLSLETATRAVSELTRYYEFKSHMT